MGQILKCSAPRVACPKGQTSSRTQQLNSLNPAAVMLADTKHCCKFGILWPRMGTCCGCPGRFKARSCKQGSHVVILHHAAVTRCHSMDVLRCELLTSRGQTVALILDGRKKRLDGPTGGCNRRLGTAYHQPVVYSRVRRLLSPHILS